tara:strand:+ start:72 stop:341 length:270 start_codon:yes stop_codon:yes gene_type:complete
MLKVMKTPCDQCLFTKNKIVSDSRRAQLLQDISKKQSHFICHKATISGTEHCCKNFYEKLGETSNMIRIAKRLNMIEFSLPEQANKVGA